MNADRSSGAVGVNVFEAFALLHQRPLQNDAALFVALTFLRGKLVHPAQLAIAVLAADIPDHVPPCKHDSVLDFAVLQIHNLQEIRLFYVTVKENLYLMFLKANVFGVLENSSDDVRRLLGKLSSKMNFGPFLSLNWCESGAEMTLVED